MVLYRPLFVFALSLLSLIHSVLANTETFLFFKQKHRTNSNSISNSQQLHQLISNYHSSPQNEHLGNGNYTIEKVTKEGLHQFSISFEPRIFTHPNDSQTRTIYVDLNSFEDDVKYGIKVSWCAINPIGIDMHLVEFEKDSVTSSSSSKEQDEYKGKDKFSNILAIEAVTDYYTIDPVGAEKYLTNVKINFHIMKNDILFGLLNQELLEMAKFVVTVVVGSVSLVVLARRRLC
ncbi:unnamed protein product [Ambrosiozyma monospora]|uniref:Unnamed protein product n=1 Tax=Ambrosiozyma monospora TaxID=43982 RepID=A0A9W7DG75_AMBMO|nr:unnamed protein product [Ambrosiozyma monospora]